MVKKERIPRQKIDAYLNHIFDNLEKDLVETETYAEEICDHCAGTGVAIMDNSFGLSEERPKYGIAVFPYKNQAIISCHYCYNGVVRRCKLCGGLMPRGRMKCDCEAQRALDREEEERKEQELLEKLPEATAEDIRNTKMFFSEYFPYNNGFFEDFDEFFEAWAAEAEDATERPEYCYGSDLHPFRFDADDIVYRQCEDHYEDAYEEVSKESIADLQDVLDTWAKENGPGETYYMHHRFKVRIPWDEMEEE